MLLSGSSQEIGVGASLISPRQKCPRLVTLTPRKTSFVAFSVEIKDQKHDLKEAWVYKSLTLIYRAMLFGRVVGICAFFPFLGNPLLTYFRFLFGTVRPFALWFYTYTSSINTNYIYFFRKERGSASYVNGCITSGGVLRAVKTHSTELRIPKNDRLWRILQ